MITDTKRLETLNGYRKEEDLGTGYSGVWINKSRIHQKVNNSVVYKSWLIPGAVKVVFSDLERGVSRESGDPFHLFLFLKRNVTLFKVSLQRYTTGPFWKDP